MLGFDSLPEGCSHIDWSSVSQYATWAPAPGEAESDVRAARLADVSGQGLTFAGEPHLCQTLEDASTLWAVGLTEA